MASPFMRPFLTPWGLQEEKYVYWKVSVGLKMCADVKDSLVYLVVKPPFPLLTPGLNKFLFFRPPELVNFRLKSLLVITFAQSKQICSIDDGDTHTRSIDLVGVESAHSATEVKDLQMKPETPMQVTPLPIFGTKCKWKPIKRD